MPSFAALLLVPSDIQGIRRSIARPIWLRARSAGRMIAGARKWRRSGDSIRRFLRSPSRVSVNERNGVDFQQPYDEDEKRDAKRKDELHGNLQSLWNVISVAELGQDIGPLKADATTTRGILL